MAKSRNVRALDVNHDQYLDENGNIARLYDSDAVLQTVKTRLLLIRQEWFLNLDAGLPWFSEMLGKYGSIEKCKSYIGSQILNTDGVVELLRLEMGVNSDRSSIVYFEYTDEYGTTSSGEI